MATLNTNTTGTLTAGMATFYDKLALSILIPALHFDKLVVKKKVQDNQGKIVSWLRYTRMAGNTTALTEGTVPNGVALTSTAVTATLSAWGDYTVIEHFLKLHTIDPIIENAVKALTHRAADTIDLLIRNAITAGATNLFANGNTALAGIGVDDIMSMADARKIRRGLRSSNVPEFSDGTYRAIIHPYQAYDFMSATAGGSFLDVHKYTDAANKKIMNSEIGKVENIRFMESTNCLTTTTGTSASATAYYAAVAGDDAVAMVDLRSGSGKPKISVLKPREAGINDPLGQYHTVAYKIESFVAKVLEASRVYNWVTGATQ